MKKTAFIYVHGVHPNTEELVPKNYSKQFHERMLRELQRFGEETALIKRFEVHWSSQTFHLKRKAARLQFDEPPRRRGKSVFRSTLKNFIYPFAIDIIHYVKNKGDETATSMMPVIDKIHEAVMQAKEQAFSEIVLFAHSLGSLACYDYIFRFEKRYPFPAGIKIKCLVTFGSPIALFASGMGHPISEGIRKPRYIMKWANFWDHDDLISARIGPHLPKSFVRNFFKDILVNTALINPAKAHGNYWKSQVIAKRIAREIL